VDISAGSIGAGMMGVSLSANGSPGIAIVDISGGSFLGSLHVVGSSRVTVSDGSFGSDSAACSLRAAGISGAAVVKVSGGSFAAGLSATYNSHVSVSGGSFGGAVSNVSVQAEAMSGNAIVDISSGTFSGGVNADSQSRVRLGGGSFGVSTFPFGTSVTANALSGTAVVEIFGGAFSGGFSAERNGTIHVYGDGLSISGASNLLTGTLADGAPISVETETWSNGQIILHDAVQTLSVPPGFSLSRTHGGTTLSIPPWILAPPPGCPLGAVRVAMEGEALGMISLGGSLVDVGGASAIVQRMGEATNPGRGPYQDTIPIELVALQLKSVEPLDLRPLGGTGTDHLFLTLQGDRGLHLLDPITGLASTGEMTIDFAMRTFDSSLDVFFDVRAGSPDGPILFTGNDTLIAMEVPWAVDLPEGWFAIPGIDDAFFAGVIGGSLVGFDQAGEFLQLRSATVLVPEPATLALLALGALGLVRRRRRA